MLSFSIIIFHGKGVYHKKSFERKFLVAKAEKLVISRLSPDISVIFLYAHVSCITIGAESDVASTRLN